MLQEEGVNTQKKDRLKRPRHSQEPVVKRRHRFLLCKFPF
jgi:hypothetical protein